MTKVHLRRLLKLADYLDTVPAKLFDYNDWGRAEPCGTVACALGHAVEGPFRRFGYRLNSNETAPYCIVVNRSGQYAAYQAIEELFGEEAANLFYPVEGEERATPKQVARKIRRFVRDHD